MSGLFLWCSWVGGAMAAAVKGTVEEVRSFSLAKSPSGMFHDAGSGLLYVLCGTETNGDHYLYAYSLAGVQQCLITIPSSAKMARVDGFWIKGSAAYIVDSQGPMWSQSLGMNMYVVEWKDPCGCASGTCTSTSVSWSPTVTASTKFDATGDVGDRAGIDAYFRNSGIAVVGTDFYSVNGVHPVKQGDYTSYYPKSLVKAALPTAVGTTSAASQKWSFTASTLGHDVDMEALSCGSDGCETYLYVGDEWNYVYRLTLGTADSAQAVEYEWDLNSIVGAVSTDKGIESMTYAASSGHFYVGIQDTSKVHVVTLSTKAAADTPAPQEASAKILRISSTLLALTAMMAAGNV